MEVFRHPTSDIFLHPAMMSRSTMSRSTKPRSTKRRSTKRRSRQGEPIPREYPERPIVGVGAVIIDERSHRVVLVRRAAPPLQGQWSLPGGVVELGETLRAA